ncbi:MAG: alpha-ribazole phosphatase [Runella slithyformis]|nr:MAG: alpha-ribazole phosphatase [Runella slithyformis]
MPLADNFTQRADSILARLPVLEAVWSSPASRCAALAARLVSTPPRVLNELAELDFGLWEGKKWSEIQSEELNSWMQDYVHAAPPSGESFFSLQERSLKALKHIEQEALKDQHTHIGVVTHAGVIRALLADCLQIPLAHAFQLEVQSGAVCHIQQKYGSFKLVLS